MLEFHQVMPEGVGMGPVVIEDLDCTGDEWSLTQCSYRPWLSSNCSHHMDVAINCMGKGGTRIEHYCIRCMHKTTNLNAKQILKDILLTANANSSVLSFKWQAS